MTKGDDFRATADHCRFAAATTSSKPTADALREMAAEYDGKAEQADAEDERRKRREAVQPNIP